MQWEPVFVTEPCGSEAFSVRFSPDDAFLAASSSHGPCSVYNVSTGQEAYRLHRGAAKPVKQVCWRPELASTSVRTRGVLVGACTDGLLRQWHVTSGQCLHEFGDPAEIGQLFCVDYNADGSRLVAGGLEDLRVFDEETKKQIEQLKGGDSMTTGGHSNRVFAARFHPLREESSIVVSGGWDNTVQFWDIRVGHAVRAVYGPHICGDALDFSTDGRVLLTGSWRRDEQLELWDFGTGRRLDVIPWRAKRSLSEPPCLLYAARFSRDPGNTLIAAGGSVPGPGGGEAKLLERSADAGSRNVSCAGTMVRFTCLSVDFSHQEGQSTLVALGGYDGRLRVMRAVAGKGT